MFTDKNQIKHYGDEWCLNNAWDNSVSTIFSFHPSVLRCVYAHYFCRCIQ